MSLDWEQPATAHTSLAIIPSQLRAGARLLAFVSGASLFRRGERPTHMLYVLDGEIRLVRHTVSGTQVILQRSRHGFIAEASLEADAYHCDIEAHAAGHLLCFPLPLLRQTLDDDPGFRRAWASRMAMEIRRLRAAHERTHLHRAADRVLHYLESEGSDGAVTLLQSRKSWATELGLSHEALYRTLRRMQRDGQIRICGKHIETVHAPTP